MIFDPILDWFKLKEVTDPPAVYHGNNQNSEDYSHNTSYSEKRYSKFTSIYQPVVFSEHCDTSEYVGSRLDYQRRDYTIDPIWYTSTQYIHSLWRHSKDLDSNKITKPRIYFEKIEEIEELLSGYSIFEFKNFYPQTEQKIYYSKKAELINSFIERSFKDEFRKALELKTTKGRVDRMENWFLQMKYYRAYMPEESQETLDNLYAQWCSEFKQIAEK